ncbi:MAG: 3-methylornithyl-N6-L-lysine dehydrogenase PylD [Desulfobacula sp.]|uniref:3-methylornithyl-N6-L-lysine dehydrogenase PylD n=1 Tax=Desulfobacula sp. TaxID=2593537 RepID=UPI0025C20BD8|nr:3-methylornithyl-N6-L-lysine dehydrogenase PylD [Desulfobacula sp.]MCD4720593.1 3-methylornithyl-N6-L-lysine dehydrogenase PylD [Desulfobacula sp.]
MTRLKTSDISNISSRLQTYNRELLIKTGRTLLGIACHAYGKDEIRIKHRIKSFSIHVVPVTAGQGIITDFSETVTAILQFLGFNALVSDKPDTSGVALAFENKADAIMMADDHRFVGINLKTRSVADNSEATGRVFAAALDLMAKEIKDREVLVLGCGPVGESAARTLLSSGAQVALCDIYLPAARLLKERLCLYPGGNKIVIEEDVNIALSSYRYIIEATPSADTIPDELISDHTQPLLLVAAPGVPLGISNNGCKILKDRLIYDKLELGVAAMAIFLLL